MEKHKNSGFTLVELIVSISILAVVGLGIGSFLYVSTRQYSAASAEAGVQTETQMVQNQLTQMLLDTSRGIRTAAGRLELYSYDTETNTGIKTVISYSGDKQELLYARYRLKEHSTGGGGRPEDWEIDGNAENEVLGQYVESFSAETLDAEGNILTETDTPCEAAQIRIHIGYDLNGRTWDSDFIVYPRNSIAVCSDPSVFYP